MMYVCYVLYLVFRGFSMDFALFKFTGCTRHPRFICTFRDNLCAKKVYNGADGAPLVLAHYAGCSEQVLIENAVNKISESSHSILFRRVWLFGKVQTGNLPL